MRMREAASRHLANGALQAIHYAAINRLLHVLKKQATETCTCPLLLATPVKGGGHAHLELSSILLEGRLSSIPWHGLVACIAAQPLSGLGIARSRSHPTVDQQLPACMQDAPLGQQTAQQLARIQTTTTMALAQSL